MPQTENGVHMKTTNKLAVLVAISGILLFSIPTPGITAQAQEKNYVLGVFPHLPPRDLEEVYAPMAADLGKAIGSRIVLRSNTTFERFMENLDKQIFDIAFVQPFDYVRIADKYGYRPLAVRKEKLATIVVVKEDSKLKTLADIKGKTVALPPRVAAVSYLLKGHLKQEKIIPGKDVKLSHHRSHMSCMQQVLIGEAVACGTAAPAVRFFEHKTKVKMRVIGKTREIPHALFVIHPRVPRSEREQLSNRILGWAKTEDGMKMLKRGKLSPFIKITDKDYNIVRELSK
jgi:phosphonate transport system substrate-binding protein